MSNNDPVMWGLVSDISQSLQISFASIKAAISSLLGGDIFWDQATQHEFMQTIDHSVDELSNLTAVMTTAMRLESGALTVQREPHSLQEVLSRAKDDVQKLAPRTPVTLTLPAEMSLAVVDYDSLLLALRLLLEVLISTRENPLAPLAVQLQQQGAGWQITFAGDFSGLAAAIVNWFCYNAPERALLAANLRPEIKLKALTAYQLFTLQAIKPTLAGSANDAGRANDAEGANAVLALYIPPATEV
jgi:hypothetical protein